jgi:hypothetical protein
MGCFPPLTRDRSLDIVNVLSVSDPARSALIAFSWSRCQVPTQLPKAENSTIALVVVMLIYTSQPVLFGGRFPWAANSQSARYDTVVNTQKL